MKIHNNYYSLQPFIFYEVAYKLSSEYVLYIVKLCQTLSSNLLTAKDFVPNFRAFQARAKNNVNKQ